MELGITTPALLFPAISLLLLAYTNRFLAIANIIRKLKQDYLDGDHREPKEMLKAQIDNLRRRIRLIQRMQEVGALSFLTCVLTMLILYAGHQAAGSIVFAVSILLLAASLAISIIEIHISVKALDLHLSDIEEQC